MKKLTEFGKITRKLRVDNDELLRSMASNLRMTASYLSAIETGKRNVPKNMISSLIYYYNLNNKQIKELNQAANNSKLYIKIDLTDLSSRDRKLVLLFAKNFRKLTKKESKEIQNILDNYS